MDADQNAESVVARVRPWPIESIFTTDLHGSSRIRSQTCGVRGNGLGFWRKSILDADLRGWTRIKKQKSVLIRVHPWQMLFAPDPGKSSFCHGSARMIADQK